MDSDDDIVSLADQYARKNCLSIDSQMDPFSLVVRTNDFVPQLTPDVEHCGLTNDDFLSQLQFPTVDIHKQLEVPGESIHILDQAFQDDDVGFGCRGEKPLTQYEARKCLAGLKFDPPALSTDPDGDCHELANAVQKQRQPNISPQVFPKERLDVTKDEGLQFPASAEQFRVGLGRTASCKKLDVYKDSIDYLARVLKAPRCEDEYQRVLAEAMPCRTFERDLELTPPLISYAEHEDHFIPGVEACEIPIASSCNSLYEDDLEAAEHAVLQKELQKDASPVTDSITPQLSPLRDAIPSGIVPSNTSSIRLESPPSPIASPPHSSWGKLIIPTLQHSMNIYHAWSSAKPSQVLYTSKTSNESQAFDDGLQAEMEESAAAVLKNIEQEHISIADAMARVEVPVMDFSIPKSEWQSLPMNTEAHMKWLREAHSLEVPPCPRDTRADSKLRWLPMLQKIDPRALTRETISPQSKDQSQLIDIPGDLEVPTSANYVWKRSDLAILREPDTEESLEDITLPTPPIKAFHDLATLARRRLGGIPTARMDTPSSDSDSYVDLVEPSHNKRPFEPASSKDPMNETKLFPNDESNSAVSKLLSKFIDIRTAKRRKFNSSSFFKPTEKPEAKSQQAATPMNDPSQHMRIERPQKKTTTMAPYPEIAVPNTPTKFIKGLTLSRGLFFALEQLYPAAEIIERDFNRSAMAFATRHPSPLPTRTPFLAAEADVIISPATGIIVTTLLKVIQKPLPGYGGQSPISERISRVAPRYERLVVLVSEGNVINETVRDFTPSEVTAYADFLGSLLPVGLGSNVEVFYVGGGEATLARWLVFLAVQHAPEAAEIHAHITHDETRWEVFLRGAGFNAYAAQAILIHLKAAAGDRGARDDGRLWTEGHGLAAFISMTGAERLHRFKGLLGGESVLRRVNKMYELRRG